MSLGYYVFFNFLFNYDIKKTKCFSFHINFPIGEKFTVYGNVNSNSKIKSLKNMLRHFNAKNICQSFYLLIKEN